MSNVRIGEKTRAIYRTQTIFLNYHWKYVNEENIEYILLHEFLHLLLNRLIDRKTASQFEEIANIFNPIFANVLEKYSNDLAMLTDIAGLW